MPPRGSDPRGQLRQFHAQLVIELVQIGSNDIGHQRAAGLRAALPAVAAALGKRVGGLKGVLVEELLLVVDFYQADYLMRAQRHKSLFS